MVVGIEMVKKIGGYWVGNGSWDCYGLDGSQEFSRLVFSSTFEELNKSINDILTFLSFSNKKFGIEC